MLVVVVVKVVVVLVVNNVTILVKDMDVKVSDVVSVK